MNYIKWFKELNKNDVALAGGKGASLGEMWNAGIQIPNGFVITAETFDYFIEKLDINIEIDSILHSVDKNQIHTINNASEKIKAIILNAEIPQEIIKEIRDTFEKLGYKFVAVRSSATSEDSSTAAWAGQLESYLNTTENELIDNVRKCWASLFTPRAIFYRIEKDLHKQQISVGVVVQKMVESEVSGVAFSVHPITQDKNQLIIEASYGLGESIVSGQVTPDSYVVEKQPKRIVNKNIFTQERGLFKSIDGGNEWRDIEKDVAQNAVLNDGEILELSELVLKIENHYGFPVDVEWARENRKFHITQSRPITTLVEKKQFVSKDDDNWVLVENIPDSDIFFFQIAFSSFIREKSYEFMTNLHKLMAVYDGFHMDFYMAKKDAFTWSESILDNFLQKPGFAKDVHKNIVKWSGLLKDYGKKLKDLDLKPYTNEQLWDLYKEHYDIHTKLYTYGWYPVQVDILFNNFTNKAKEYLSEVCQSKKEIEQAFILLTTPAEKSIIAEEREELFHLYNKHQNEIKIYGSNKNNKPSKELNASIALHREKWGHLGYIYAGNASLFPIKHYLDELIEIEQSEESIKQILDREQKQLKEAKAKQNEFYKDKKTPDLYKRLFQSAIDFSLSKLIRRDCQLFTLYQCHHILLEKIASRLGVSRHQVQFMLGKEVYSALVENKLDKDILSKRLEGCVYLVNEEKESVYVGKKASALKSEIKEEIDFNGEQFTGQIAQPGYAKGIVKTIIRAQDMHKMNEGDILVSIATDPDIVSAMKKAAAIVTDQGGITSHAAIVSREMGTPCIIGTKIGSKILKDGMLVEVDANEGVVRILS